MLKKRVLGLVAIGVLVSSSIPVYASTKISEVDESSVDSICMYNGAYILQGSPKDDKDDSLYYIKGDSIKEVEDAEDYDISIKLGAKNLIVHKGGDMKVIDMGTGKALEDDYDDILDTAKKNLGKKIKKVDKYVDDAEDTISDFELVDNTTYNDMLFTCYVNNDKGGKSKIVTSYNGAYIDLSSKADLDVYNKKTGKMVSIERFGKEKEGVTVNFKDSNVLTSDKSNIYVKTYVEVVQDGDTEDKVFIQRLSKSEEKGSGDESVAKTVDSFEITEAFDAKNVKDIKNQIDTSLFFVVSDKDTLHAVKTNGDKIRVTRINLENDKVKFTSTRQAEGYTKDSFRAKYVSADKITTESMSSNSSFALDSQHNIWILDDGEISKYDKGANKFVSAYKCSKDFTNLSVYKDGQVAVWKDGGEYGVLTDSKNITTSSSSKSSKDKDDDDKDDKDNKKDSSSSSSSSTSSSSSASSGNQVQHTSTSTSTSNSSQTKVDYTKETLATVQGMKLDGWCTTTTGKWVYFDKGVLKANDWVSYNNSWYYLDEKGIMISDTTKVINGVNYAFDDTGKMRTGWVQLKGNWYYLYSNGSMAKGWQKLGDIWYYFKPDGIMASNCIVDGYKLDASGAWVE